jgi:TonB family protein
VGCADRKEETAVELAAALLLLFPSRRADTDKLLDLGQHNLTVDPRTRRIRAAAIGAAIAVHVLVLGALIYIPRHKPERVTVAHEGGISAFVNVAMPVGTTGTRAPAARPRPVPKAPSVMPAELRASTADSAPAQESSGAAQGGAPVRMSVGQLQLIRKVEPLYPPAMIRARQDGSVVLDAIIHPDGTIGDITVLQSLNPFFDHAATAAVKQWQYTPIGHEAIVTVTVKFTLR